MRKRGKFLYKNTYYSCPPLEGGPKSLISRRGKVGKGIFNFCSSQIAHHVARSEFLSFLYPSLKFLSSHNSLRNFFSPSRGESRKFRLTKLKISTIFLNKSNFINSNRLCLFASKSALLDFPLSSSLSWREDIRQIFQHLRLFTNRSE